MLLGRTVLCICLLFSAGVDPARARAFGSDLITAILSTLQYSVPAL